MIRASDRIGSVLTGETLVVIVLSRVIRLRSRRIFSGMVVDDAITRPYRKSMRRVAA
jgi:hypothetical protein